jgi:hypothetical protein
MGRLELRGGPDAGADSDADPLTLAPGTTYHGTHPAPAGCLRSSPFSAVLERWIHALND